MCDMRKVSVCAVFAACQRPCASIAKRDTEECLAKQNHCSNFHVGFSSLRPIWYDHVNMPIAYTSRYPLSTAAFKLFEITQTSFYSISNLHSISTSFSGEKCRMNFRVLAEVATIHVRSWKFCSKCYLFVKKKLSNLNSRSHSILFKPHERINCLLAGRLLVPQLLFIWTRRFIPTLHIQLYSTLLRQESQHLIYLCMHTRICVQCIPNILDRIYCDRMRPESFAIPYIVVSITEKSKTFLSLCVLPSSLLSIPPPPSMHKRTWAWMCRKTMTTISVSTDALIWTFFPLPLADALHLYIKRDNGIVFWWTLLKIQYIIHTSIPRTQTP